jgi:hypothetical protein
MEDGAWITLLNTSGAASGETDDAEQTHLVFQRVL